MKNSIGIKKEEKRWIKVMSAQIGLRSIRRRGVIIY